MRVGAGEVPAGAILCWLEPNVGKQRHRGSVKNVGAGKRVARSEDATWDAHVPQQRIWARVLTPRLPLHTLAGSG